MQPQLDLANLQADMLHSEIVAAAIEFASAPGVRAGEGLGSELKLGLAHPVRHGIDLLNQSSEAIKVGLRTQLQQSRGAAPLPRLIQPGILRACTGPRWNFSRSSAQRNGRSLRSLRRATGSQAVRLMPLMQPAA